MTPQIRMSNNQRPTFDLHHASNSDNQDGGSNENQGSTTERQQDSLRSRHDVFVAALDMHGGDLTRRDWSQFASDLGWSVDEVQSYAFQYLVSLLNSDRTRSARSDVSFDSYIDSSHSTKHEQPSAKSAEQHSTIKSNGVPNRKSRSGSSLPWTLDEVVLFDTLVATYFPIKDPDGFDWEELVASHLPGRTATEVRRRWNQLSRESKRLGDA